MKLTPLCGRIIVESRGVEEETDSGVIVPERYLDDSDICTTKESGVRIIRKRGSGVPIGDRTYLIEEDDVLAVMVNDEWNPTGKNVLVRKCLDPEDRAGLVSLSDRTTRFAEILAAGPDSGLEDDIGGLAYVDDIAEKPQKVEDTIDDWIISSNVIEFVMGD